MESVLNWFMALPERAIDMAAAPSAVWWLFLWAFAESSFFPVPPDVLLIAMCLARPEEGFLFALAASAASVAGGVVGYGIGYFGGRPIARRLISESKLAAAEELYGRYDVWAVGIAGFTPVPYKVFTILSGLLRVRMWRFVAASAVSRSARFFLVALVLFFWGEEAREFITRYFGWLTLALGLGIAGGFVLLAWKGPRRASSGGTSGETGAAPSESPAENAPPQG